MAPGFRDGMNQFCKVIYSFLNCLLFLPDPKLQELALAYPQEGICNFSISLSLLGSFLQVLSTRLRSVTDTNLSLGKEHLVVV